MQLAVAVQHRMGEIQRRPLKAAASQYLMSQWASCQMRIGALLIMLGVNGARMNFSQFLERASVVESWDSVTATV